MHTGPVLTAVLWGWGAILGSTVASVAPAALPAAGAPLICFPLELPDGVKLPSGEDGSGAVERLGVEVAKACEDQADVTVHMEALRRACLVASGARGAADGGTAAWRDVIDALELAVLRLETRMEVERGPLAAARARAWFDLGYAHAVGRVMAFERPGDPDACFVKAVELGGEDAGLRFGVALALYDRKVRGHEEGEAKGPGCYKHLGLALQGGDERLRRNAVFTFGSFLECRTHEQLVAAVRAKLAGA